MRAALALMLFLSACSRPAPPLQLWYWHHSYLTTPESLAKSKALVDRAAAAGYTGVALWDSSLIFVSNPGWNATYLKQFIDYAHSKDLAVMPAILPYGHSDDILKQNPNWAEGKAVVGVRFRREGDTLHPLPTVMIPMEGGQFAVEPWHLYTVHFAPGATGDLGALDSGDSHLARLVDVAHPGRADFTFNSAASSRLHIFGPTAFTVEEAALISPLRRSGTPLKVYDQSQTFQEGTDFEPITHTTSTVRIPPASRIRDGQDVSIDYYSVTTIEGEGVGVCLSDPQVQQWAAFNARTVSDLLPTDSPLFLQHDEMRHMNSCASCRRMQMSAGQLLAWSLRRLIPSLPSRSLYIWSDMFDPWHNAHDHYYYVEGDLAGSWKGLPQNVTVMNWNNGPHRRSSLEFFSKRGNPQVIAGYYDPPNRDGQHAAETELAAAKGIRGVAGVMYTTWGDDYSQLEPYARAARAQWPKYISARPW